MKKLLQYILLGLITLPMLAQTPRNGSISYSSATLTGSAQLIAAPPAGRSIYIQAFTIQIQQSASPVTWGLSSGTGSACGTGNTLVTPQYLGYASIQQSLGATYNSPIVVSTAKALCFTTSGTPTGAVVHVVYSIQ